MKKYFPHDDLYINGVQIETPDTPSIKKEWVSEGTKIKDSTCPLKGVCLMAWFCKIKKEKKRA